MEEQEPVIELSTLDGGSGIIINGIDVNDGSGVSVSSAGDVNNDGIDDLIIGAPDADPNDLDAAGESYVVFGTSVPLFGGILSLSGLNGNNGFAINGIDAGDRSGFSVSGAGDVNNDGIDDLIIGAPQADPNNLETAGESYVVFGSSTLGSDGIFNLSSLNGSNGFTINGMAGGDRSGLSVSTAGDISGDGIDDLIIGAPNADPNGLATAGETYIVLGNSTIGSTGILELSSLNGSNGLAFNGIDEGDRSGFSVSGAGDVNGDGTNDLIIGAPDANANGIESGESYVVFGGPSILQSPGSLDLSLLNGVNGFVMNGVERVNFSGSSVSSAGDLNGDGFNDLIIGSPGADSNDNRSGESYVVFGGSTVGTGGTIELGNLNGSDGFALNGIDRADNSGTSVSGIGDFNGDGFDDLIVGAPNADPNRGSSGESYVVFGSSTIGAGGAIELSNFDGSNGFVLNGVTVDNGSGTSVNSAGDFNGDGGSDLIIGAPGSNGNAGQTYVVFGSGDGNGNGNGNGNDDFTLDIDGDGELIALTDGLLVVRFLFGLTGDALIGGAVGTGASRDNADDIINYLNEAQDTILDVDDNGTPDALTDGIMIIRYLFGLRGDALIGGAIADNANRTSVDDIEAFFSSIPLPVADSGAGLFNSLLPNISGDSLTIA